MRADVQHAAGARRQPVENTGGRVTGWGRPRRPRSDKRGNAPQGRVPRGRPRNCSRGPPARSPGQRPVAGLHQLSAVVLLQQLLQRRGILCGQLLSAPGSGQPGRARPRTNPCPLTPPQPRLCAFSSPAHRARKGSTASHAGQRARLPKARRRGEAEHRSARGWGQTSLLTFLLCDQAHQDPDGVLTGVLRPAGRAGPWRRERTTRIPGKKRVGPSPARRLRQNLAAEGAPGLGVRA